MLHDEFHCRRARGLYDEMVPPAQAAAARRASSAPEGAGAAPTSEPVPAFSSSAGWYLIPAALEAAQPVRPTQPCAPCVRRLGMRRCRSVQAASRFCCALRCVFERGCLGGPCAATGLLPCTPGAQGEHPGGPGLGHAQAGQLPGDALQEGPGEPADDTALRPTPRRRRHYARTREHAAQ